MISEANSASQENAANKIKCLNFATSTPIAVNKSTKSHVKLEQETQEILSFTRLSTTRKPTSKVKNSSKVKKEPREKRVVSVQATAIQEVVDLTQD
jgi:hypothetical protein